MRSFRAPLLLLSLIGAVTSTSARAQQPVVYPASCEASRVSKGDIERAHAVFLSGKQYLDESNYDKAIGYFVDAYSIDCSVHGILPIIATAFERKGDRTEALRALAEYQQRSPAAADHDVVERRIKNLKDQLAKEQTPPVVVPPTPVPASGPAAPTGPAAAPTPVEPASEPGASLPPGMSLASASPAVEANGARSSRVGPWILIGGGGAAVVTGATLLGVGASDVSTAANRCPSRANCSKDDAAQGNRGRTLEAVGVAAGSLGAAAVVGGVVWLFAQPSRTATPAVGWRALPAAAPGYVGVLVARHF